MSRENSVPKEVLTQIDEVRSETSSAPELEPAPQEKEQEPPQQGTGELQASLNGAKEQPSPLNGTGEH